MIPIPTRQKNTWPLQVTSRTTPNS